ncbi:MAG: hypothetical protein AAF560_29455 [Acidobacteriota bacterium]
MRQIASRAVVVWLLGSLLPLVIPAGAGVTHRDTGMDVTRPALNLGGALIFGDSFESGDTSAWSSAVGLRSPFLQLPARDAACDGGTFGWQADSDGFAGSISVAEDFDLTADFTLEMFRIWGAYAQGSEPPDDFTVIVHTREGGVPGVALSTQENVASVRALTGVTFDEFAEWEYVISLNTPVELAAGSYFLEIFNNTVDSGDTFFVECGFLDTRHGFDGLVWSDTTPGSTWNQVMDDLAFEIIR